MSRITPNPCTFQRLNCTTLTSSEKAKGMPKGLSRGCDIIILQLGVSAASDRHEALGTSARSSLANKSGATSSSTSFSSSPSLSVNPVDFFEYPPLPDPLNSPQEESRLLNFLMKRYDKDVRPINDHRAAVQVQVGITLTQIFDMVRYKDVRSNADRLFNIAPRSMEMAQDDLPYLLTVVQMLGKEQKLISKVTSVVVYLTSPWPTLL